MNPGRVVLACAAAVATGTAAAQMQTPPAGSSSPSASLADDGVPQPWQRTYALSVPAPGSTRLLYERSVPLWAGRTLGDSTPVNRIGIEFRPRSSTAQLRDLGVFRVQLSRSSNVSMRPRRGGIAVSWRATF